MASFSAIISNYNASAFIAQALESALGQSLSPIEIIVADDGSSDDSFQRAGIYMGKIKWLALPHQGQGPALEEAVRLSQGDWIAFLESDDVWTRGKLERVMERLSRIPAAAAVQHRQRQVDARLQEITVAADDPDETWGLADFLSGKYRFSGLSALCARRSVLLRVLPFPKDLAACLDEYLAPRLLDLGACEYIGAALGLRRIHGGNFYAGAAQDRGRLRRYLSLRRVLDRHLENFLLSRNLKLSKPIEREMRAETLQMEFFLNRSEKQWAAALRNFFSLVYLWGFRPYVFFKAAALGLALFSPPLYWKAHAVYEKSPALVKLRRRALP